MCEKESEKERENLGLIKRRQEGDAGRDGEQGQKSLVLFSYTNICAQTNMHGKKRSLKDLWPGEGSTERRGRGPTLTFDKHERAHGHHGNGATRADL